MQAIEKNTRREKTTTTLVTCFKPRQLLLNSNSNMAKITSFSLSDQQRVLLFQSICQFFQKNGFSKSLKKFTKEANLQKESWKSCVLDLEEMCYQFLKTRNDNKVGESDVKEQVTNKKDKSNHVEPIETIEKTKKNKGDEGKVEDTPKKKKKTNASESSEQITEENHTEAQNEPEKKSKDKKKKHKEESQDEKKEEKSKQVDVSQDRKKEKSKSKKKKDDDSKIEDSNVEDTKVDNEKEGSKKRKKSSSEEIENGDIEEQLVGDSKRRKTDNMDQSNETIVPKTPNGIFENGERKESQKKEKSKQRNGSTEPKSAANAFKRVKEEEVEFVDERLQDNSYWAKDGAETGYGAKAQEVLGQVRGRGFRHEKTKKKRGSYRGGQIDLESHSIKFNYDDDDE